MGVPKRYIIEGIAKNRMRFDILSNGALITDEIAAFLHSTGRCDGVQISIDGFTPMTHDSCRGKGSFIEATKGINTLQKYKIPVTVRVTLHKQNVRDLDGVAELLLEEIRIPGFSINSASYMGLCRQNAEDLQLNVEERLFAMETLLKLSKKYNGRISATSGPLADAKMWLKMGKARREGKEPLENCGSLTACGCVTNRMGVRADGVMVPCILLGQIELGRINKDSLQEVWQNHPSLKRLRRRRSIPLSDFKFCQGCDYMNYCTGNCPASAYNLLGNDQHPSPDAFLRNFLEVGGRLPDEKLLMKYN